MSKDFLEDRRAGLEEAFFAKQNEMLRQKLRSGDDDKARRDAMAAATGITDPAVIDQLISAGITAETLTALSVIPLVVVAWADGSVKPAERDMVLANADKSGLKRGDTGHTMLESWLKQKPGPDLLATWKSYTSALCATLAPDARDALKADLMGRARQVAGAAGGFMGLGQISPEEKTVLAELEQAFR